MNFISENNFISNIHQHSITYTRIYQFLKKAETLLAPQWTLYIDKTSRTELYYLLGLNWSNETLENEARAGGGGWFRREARPSMFAV